jgi:hypothetical protein
LLGLCRSFLPKFITTRIAVISAQSKVRENFMSIVDLLLYIRSQFLEARAKKDAETLRSIWGAIDLFVEAAYQTKDKQAAGVLEDIGDSIRDALMSEEWKSTVPTEERIKAIGETQKVL